MLPAPPVVLDGLDVLDDVGVEPPVERVVGMLLAGLGTEQELHPLAALGKALPQAVSVNLERKRP